MGRIIYFAIFRSSLIRKDIGNIPSAQQQVGNFQFYTSEYNRFIIDTIIPVHKFTTRYNFTQFFLTNKTMEIFLLVYWEARRKKLRSHNVGSINERDPFNILY